jgi:hypothetical protein
MYSVSQVITNPGAVTNLNLQAHATKPFVVVRVIIELAQATIPPGFLNHDPSDADAGFTAGHTATAEGTDGDFIERGWYSSQGLDVAPTPEEYIMIPAGTANGFGVKHNVAPPAGNYAFTVTVHEIG